MLHIIGKSKEDASKSTGFCARESVADNQNALLKQ
jgi:hypothetical protein